MFLIAFAQNISHISHFTLSMSDQADAMKRLSTQRPLSEFVSLRAKQGVHPPWDKHKPSL